VFLGAGVSIPSGLPGALDVTSGILQPPRTKNKKLSQITSILIKIRDYDSDDIGHPGMYRTKTGFAHSGAINRGKSSTYEDIFFLCNQIRMWGIGAIDNSLATPFIERVVKICGPILGGVDI
jgi:hypothetical protein